MSKAVSEAMILMGVMIVRVGIEPLLFMDLWAWFIAPVLGVAPLSWLTALGLLLTWSFLSIGYAEMAAVRLINTEGWSEAGNVIGMFITRLGLWMFAAGFHGLFS